jgi:hypothetical protein
VLGLRLAESSRTGMPARMIRRPSRKIARPLRWRRSGIQGSCHNEDLRISHALPKRTFSKHSTPLRRRLFAPRWGLKGNAPRREARAKTPSS